MAEQALSKLFAMLHTFGVKMDGAVLVTSFVTAGKERADVSVETVANYTAQVLLRTVPPMFPGVFLLAGGGVCMR
eukprot:415906-Alexandrium_andersonii.AAC.1